MSCFQTSDCADTRGEPTVKEAELTPGVVESVAPAPASVAVKVASTLTLPGALSNVTPACRVNVVVAPAAIEVGLLGKEYAAKCVETSAPAAEVKRSPAPVTLAVEEPEFFTDTTTGTRDCPRRTKGGTRTDCVRSVGVAWIVRLTSAWAWPPLPSLTATWTR